MCPGTSPRVSFPQFLSLTHTHECRQTKLFSTHPHSTLPPHSLPAVPSLILIPTSRPRLFSLPSPSCDPEDKPQQPSLATRRHQLTTAISSSDRNSASRALCGLAPCSPSQAPHPSTAAGCSGMFSRASYSHSKVLVPSSACTHEATESSGASRVHPSPPSIARAISPTVFPAQSRGSGCPHSESHIWSTLPLWRRMSQQQNTAQDFSATSAHNILPDETRAQAGFR